VEQTIMDELQALKFLSGQWGRDEEFTARFRRELRTLRPVRHRNFVDCGGLERAEDDPLRLAKSAGCVGLRGPEQIIE
jgi:hypothetical protein